MSVRRFCDGCGKEESSLYKVCVSLGPNMHSADVCSATAESCAAKHLDNVRRLLDAGSFTKAVDKANGDEPLDGAPRLPVG
jgi:hypothetical protein